MNHHPEGLKEPSIPLLMGIGLVAGVVSGFFGVGGGIVFVPCLLIFAKYPQKLATRTSLLAVPIAGLGGLIVYAIEQNIDIAIGITMLLGSSLGALVGTFTLTKISQKILQVILSVMFIVIAIRLFVPFNDSDLDGEYMLKFLAAYVALGIFVGMVSGLTGLGGGVFIVSGLVILFNIEPEVARGTSLFILVPTTLLGSLPNIYHKRVKPKISATMGMGSFLGGFIGSAVSLWLDSPLALRIFGGFVFLVGVRFALKSFRTS